MRTIALLLLVMSAGALAGCVGPAGPPQRPADDPDRALAGDAWAGPAIAYSGYREAQSPKDGTLPTRDQVAEDLRILAKHWRLIRVYAADRHAEDVLEVIRSEGLDLRVMLGIWLDREPGWERDNAHEIEEGIRLAAAYDDLIVAVNVGNEVLIEWTEHPVPEERVVDYVRRVRSAVSQPVTVADNYVWWRDHGADLAREVDFITIHTYPLWERRDIDEGLSYTIENYEGVRDAHPGKRIVIGEAGWATYTEGNLHVPRGGDETKQTRYFAELTAWAEDEGVPLFFFEAFDEPWKGTGTEGHWGLFTVDREAKPAVQALYPERMPDGPTSPAYPETIPRTGPDPAVPLRSDLADALPAGAYVEPMGPGLAESEVVASTGAEGGSALRLVFTGEAWSGLYVFLGGHDAAGASALAMRLRLPDDVARFELKLEGPENHGSSVELLEHVVGRDDAGWTEFSVPLSAFEGADLSQVAIVGLWNPSDRDGEFVRCEIVVDDVRFE